MTAALAGVRALLVDLEGTVYQDRRLIPGAAEALARAEALGIPHRFVTSYVWMLPKLTHSAAWIRHTVGGWESSGLLTLQSGQPFSIASGTDRSFSGLGIDYADLVGNPYLDTSRARKDSPRTNGMT